jgi:erythromycin esterase-like protein
MSFLEQESLDDWFHSPSHTPMGEFLAERFGDSYLSIGFAFAEGTNLGRAHGRFVVSDMPLVEGSLGANLDRLDTPLLFLDLRRVGVGSAAAWLSEPQFMRNVGSSATSMGFRTVTPSSSFDALLFVDRISPSHPLVD